MASNAGMTDFSVPSVANINGAAGGTTAVFTAAANANGAIILTAGMSHASSGITDDCVLRVTTDNTPIFALPGNVNTTYNSLHMAKPVYIPPGKGVEFFWGSQGHLHVAYRLL